MNLLTISMASTAIISPIPTGALPWWAWPALIVFAVAEVWMTARFVAAVWRWIKRNL